MSLRAGALQETLGLEESAALDLLKEAWSKHDEAWKRTETFGPGRMAAYCLEKHGVEDDAALASLSKVFEEATLEGGVEAAEGVSDTMQALRVAGIRIGLVCDTGFSSGKVVRGLLEQVDLARWIEVFSFSDEVGVPKPGPDIFANALAGLNASPGEAAHIGDLKLTDVAGAQAFGMKAVRYRGIRDDKTNAPDTEVVIDRHEEILDLLGIG